MRNIFVAFFLGAVLTATAFFLVRPEPRLPLLTERSEQLIEDVSTPGPQSSTAEGESEVITASGQEDSETSEEQSADEVVALDVPITIPRLPRPGLFSSDGQPIQTDTASDVHSKIEHEPIDPGWASITESELYGFYAQSAVLVAEFDLPSIECRSTMCLIQGVGEDPQSRGAWGREMRKLFEEPWGSQFGRLPIAAEYYLTSEGQAAALWYLEKKDVSDSHAQSAAGSASAI